MNKECFIVMNALKKCFINHVFMNTSLHKCVMSPDGDYIRAGRFPIPKVKGQRKLHLFPIIGRVRQELLYITRLYGFTNAPYPVFVTIS